MPSLDDGVGVVEEDFFFIAKHFSNRIIILFVVGEIIMEILVQSDGSGNIKE